MEVMKDKVKEYKELLSKTASYVDGKIKELNSFVYICDDELYSFKKAIMEVMDVEKSLYGEMDLDEKQEVLFDKVVFEAIYNSVDIIMEAMHKRNAIWYENMDVVNK